MSLPAEAVENIRRQETKPVSMRQTKKAPGNERVFDVEYILPILGNDFVEVSLVPGGIFLPTTFFVRGEHVLQSLHWGGISPPGMVFPIRNLDTAFSMLREDGSTNPKSPFAPRRPGDPDPDFRGTLFFGQTGRFIFRQERAVHIASQEILRSDLHIRGIFTPYQEDT